MHDCPQGPSFIFSPSFPCPDSLISSRPSAEFRAIASSRMALRFRRHCKDGSPLPSFRIGDFAPVLLPGHNAEENRVTAWRSGGRTATVLATNGQRRHCSAIRLIPLWLSLECFSSECRPNEGGVAQAALGAASPFRFRDRTQSGLLRLRVCPRTVSRRQPGWTYRGITLVSILGSDRSGCPLGLSDTVPGTSRSPSSSGTNSVAVFVVLGFSTASFPSPPQPQNTASISSPAILLITRPHHRN